MMNLQREIATRPATSIYLFLLLVIGVLLELL